MSPAKYPDSDVTKGVINGPRPMPLRINKDSHVIHKPPSNQPAADATPAAKSHGQSAARRHQPVIIYTHSPKIIHASASNFMALVQKLTGMSRDEVEGDDDGAAKSEAEAKKEEDTFSDEKSDCGVNNINSNLGFMEICETTTSAMADDQRFMCDVKQQDYKMSSPFLVEAPPLFTPSSNEFFCSSSRPSSLFPTPNMAANAISPSFMDYMKAFPDY